MAYLKAKTSVSARGFSPLKHYQVIQIVNEGYKVQSDVGREVVIPFFHVGKGKYFSYHK